MIRNPAPSFLLFVCLAAGSAAAADKADGAREELRQLKSRIESLQKQLSDTEGSKTEVVDALKESERAISTANRELNTLSGQAREASQSLVAIRADSEKSSTTLKAQRAHLSRLVYERYVNGPAEPLRLALSGRNPNELSRQSVYLAHVSRARAGLINSLRGNLEHLSELAKEAEEKARELAEIATRQAKEKQKLESERRARSDVLARISRDIQKQRKEMSTLQRDENRLAKLVEQLSRIITRPPPSARQAPATPRMRNERVPERQTAETGAFGQLRGRLALPVRGDIAGRFGTPRADGGLTWRGLFIAARSGEEIRAVAAGRVVFADWLRGFGNLLIVDHGDGYMSLYGNGEALYKQVGELIRGGDAIATVGNSGGNTVSGLYFEMRHQGKPFDPMGWVGGR